MCNAAGERMMRVRQRNGASTRQARAVSITQQEEPTMSPSHAELLTAEVCRQVALASADDQRLAQTASHPNHTVPPPVGSGLVQRLINPGNTETLNISLRTVNQYIGAILAKLEAANRLEARVNAGRFGLL
jgi:hypothetical protein